MKNFTYRSFEEKENIEEILKRRKRKVNRQQIISGIILMALLGAIGLYIGHHIYYTQLDGYVHVDTNKVRTPFDIYLDSVYVKTGDLVTPGDTLYSYYMLDLLVDNANPDEEPPMVAVSRNYKLQYETMKQQIEVLRVRIEELKKQIGRESHNIALGLSSNSHKLDLERELKETEAHLRALMGELGAVQQTRNETKVVFDRNRLAGDGSLIPQIYDDARSASMRRAVSYRLASDSAMITDVKAPVHMIFFKEEEILSKQHLNLEANNLKVVAYVPVDKMSKITNNSVAEVVVNNDVKFKASVSILGTRAEMIPENLRSYFSKKNTAVIAILSVDKNQTIPLWALASGMPVSVRIKNYHFGKEEEVKKVKPDYLWFTTGKGVMVENKKGHLVPMDSAQRVGKNAQGATKKAQPSKNSQGAVSKAQPSKSSEGTVSKAQPSSESQPAVQKAQPSGKAQSAERRDSEKNVRKTTTGKAEKK